MKLRIILTFLTVCILALAMGSVVAQTEPFKSTISGSAGFPLEMVSTSSGERWIGMGICGGKSNLGGGKYICTTSGYSVVEYAGENTDRCPGGMEFVYTSGEESHIVRFFDGEVLYMVPKYEQSYYNNYHCLYFCDPADNDCPMMGFYAVDYKTWEFIGGSGRFQGATGEASWELRGDPVP